MKVKVLKPVTLTAQPGSVVEVKDDEIKFLRGYVEVAEGKKEEKPEPKEEKPKAKAKAKK